MSPNDFGRKFLVEECTKIKISDVTKQFQNQAKEAFLNTEFEALENKIELTTSNTGFGGKRYWFKCPICFNRVGVLYKHPLWEKLGCRECLGLDYRKRKYKGMPEADIA